MVSRTETARALLTQGEIMQLPDTDEIVMLAGAHPISAKKARYYADPRLKKRVERPPVTEQSANSTRSDDWDEVIARPNAPPDPVAAPDEEEMNEAAGEGGIRREPGLPEHEDVLPSRSPPPNEFDFTERRDDDAAVRNRQIADRMRANARRAALDPGDGIDL